MQILSSIVFALASALLAALSLALMGLGGYKMLEAYLHDGSHLEDAVLGAVGYVIIAIAVFDVAKFLMEEEVLNGRERRIASEARRSLTKFISTIAIAIFLEALVTVFRVSADRVEAILYPTLLLVAGTVLVLGLGLFQRLSASVESVVEHQDRLDESDAPSAGPLPPLP